MLALGFQWLPSARTFVIFTNAQIIFYAALVVLLPLAFTTSGRHPIDRFLGELSYPLYLGHIAVIVVVATKLPWLAKEWQAVIALSAATLLAAGCYLFIDRPIDQIRHARFVRRAAVAVA